MRKLKKVLTIAGSDPTGGAGIQADLKTMTVLGVYGMSVITAITAQNTVGVRGVWPADEKAVEEQIDCVFEDIPPDAVKIGMVANEGIIRSIAAKLREHRAKNIVLDPVMVSTSGGRLMDEGAEKALLSELFPLADLTTPNLAEAGVLWGRAVTDRQGMRAAAKDLYDRFGTALLLKGGHLLEGADDLLYDGEETWFRAARIDNPNTHGTGCTLSSAIACGLAQGLCLQKSIEKAKEYLTGAIGAGLDLGKGRGPLDHLYRL